ncbi:protein WFDC9-like [Trichechus manatus latirostris]|uniref:Protein WFDC9-like n=1 Tax=Trichechus manatus latirostris TaxID=127582 RepID=A0A2Y9QAN6_TRIMA|nr:protein WFDC9-like [Trichechus manatus latirostris]
MKLQVLLLIMLAYVVVMILPVQGSLWEKTSIDETVVEPCEYLPKSPKYCNKNCTPDHRCRSKEARCCRTYCGNICLKDGQFARVKV